MVSLSGSFSRFKSDLNATVASISQQTVSPKTWVQRQQVTSYNVFSSHGQYSKNIRMRNVPMGENKKVESVIRKKAKMDTLRHPIKFETYVYDEVTPTLLELEIWLGEVAGKQLSTGFEKSLIQKIKQKYRNRNDGSWEPNTTMWSDYKERFGHTNKPMHMHDSSPYDPRQLGTIWGDKSLSENVSNVEDKIRVEMVTPNYYRVTGLDEAFADSPYVFFHESGYFTKGAIPFKFVPARPFIAPAINEAMAQATAYVLNRTPFERKRRKMTKPMTYKLGAYGQYQMQVGMSIERFLMALWWFMPQVQEYQYIAYAHDAMGYLSGHFVTSETMKNFVTALMAGKAGQVSGIPLTPKLARRTSRKALWGTETISVTGGR